jgi:hypothetical protein
MKKHKAKRSDSHRKKISENMKSAWADGSRSATKSQTDQAKKNLEKIHSNPDFGKIVSARLKREHAEGIRDCSHLQCEKAKIAAAEAKRNSKVFQDAAKKNAKLLQRPEVQTKRLESLRKSPKAKAAVLRMRKGLMKSPKCQKGKDHHSGAMWHIRSPENVTYSFKNLNQFIRDNPQLFLQEDLEKKAYRGISMLRPNPGKIRVSGTWKGWTWASLTEIFHNDGEDLLLRPNESNQDRSSE